MRILFIGAHFPRPANTTNGVWALAQVSALRDAGHQLQVISPVPAIPRWVSRLLRRGSSADCPPSYDWNGITAHYIRWAYFPVGPLAKWSRRWPNIFIPAAWLLSRHRLLDRAVGFAPDVVLAHHAQIGGYMARRVAARLSVPFFIVDHDFAEIEQCATSASRRRHYRSALAGVGQWIAVSNRMRESMARIFPNIASCTVYNGGADIPAEVLRAPRPPADRTFTVVLSACFLYKRKRVPLLVRAFDRVATAHPEALLILIGDGEDHPAVAAAVAQAGARGRIRFLGGLNHRDTLQQMVWCDVFANVGVDEPFGVVLAEAMSAGKPIVWCKDGGMSDLAVDGTHGLSVEPDSESAIAQALDRLLSQPAARTRMAEAARALAHTRLTWSLNAAQLVSLFRAAAAGSRTSP
jgi:glycosyltransferase involved in cell wall biosynthesis